MLWFRKIEWFIDGVWSNLMARSQRFRRGYSETDVWNIDCWFVGTLVPMMEHWIEDGMGYPDEDIGESGWDLIRGEMLEGFKLYKQCYVDGGIPIPEDEWETMEMFGEEMVVSNRMELTPEEYLKFKRSLYLFMKHFNNLWD
jgi:hypothetical protein